MLYLTSNKYRVDSRRSESKGQMDKIFLLISDVNSGQQNFKNFDSLKKIFFVHPLRCQDF